MVANRNKKASGGWRLFNKNAITSHMLILNKQWDRGDYSNADLSTSDREGHHICFPLDAPVVRSTTHPLPSGSMSRTGLPLFKKIFTSPAFKLSAPILAPNTTNSFLTTKPIFYILLLRWLCSAQSCRVNKQESIFILKKYKFTYCFLQSLV